MRQEGLADPEVWFLVQLLVESVTAGADRMILLQESECVIVSLKKEGALVSQKTWTLAELSHLQTSALSAPLREISRQQWNRTISHAGDWLQRTYDALKTSFPDAGVTEKAGILTGVFSMGWPSEPILLAFSAGRSGSALEIEMRRIAPAS